MEYEFNSLEIGKYIRFKKHSCISKDMKAMEKCHAELLRVRAMQRKIFGSNKSLHSRGGRKCSTNKKKS